VKNFLSFLGFLIVLALIGGGGYLAYDHYKAKEDSPVVKACKVEKGMLDEAVKQANARTGDGDLTDPSSYYTSQVALTYYHWAGQRPNFLVTPLGTPPC